MPVASDDEEPFRPLVEGVSDYAICLVDGDGQVRSANPDTQRMIERATRDGRAEEEAWRVHKDGTRSPAHVIITALRDSDGTLRGFTQVTRDRTERASAAGELHDSELSLRTLVDSIHDYAVFMLDPHGTVATWNPGAERIKGYASREIIGRHFSAFYAPEEVAAGKCERELEIASTTGKFEEESWRVRKDGTRFFAHVVLRAMRDDSGKLVGFAKVTRDLTERRRAEDERLRLAHAEEALKLRDNFLSIASHELKTPLTSLQLLLSGMQRAFARQQHALDLPKLGTRIVSVDREVARIVRLVDDLLDVSRASSGRLHLRLEPVNLAGVVREVADRFEDTLAAAGCKLTVTLDDSVVGRWDRLRLDQVVTNFLTNAVKYGAGHPIEIRVAQKGDAHAIVAVRDHGIGIAADDQARIFDRFTRAVSPSHYGGLGLGLFIVRAIVEALGGTVSIASEPGKGAEFVAELPLAAPVES